MKKLIPILFVLACAIPARAATCGVYTISGTCYYLSPSGNDSSAGTSTGTAWLTAYHSVNCGDMLLAATGTYSAANFQNHTWGAVTCSGGNNVAWVACATPFGCSISTTGASSDVSISASYWGIQGFVLTNSNVSYACLDIEPDYDTGVQISHIIVANNIAGPCGADGIDINDGYGTTPTTGVDYVAFVGNIAYSTGGASGSCSAGFSFYYPIASDANAGTHLYMAGNFAWGNTSNCGDGEGIIFDSFDAQDGGWPPSTGYSQEAVAENNLSVWNAGPGIQADLNQAGPGPWATIKFVHNTSAYNCQGTSSNTECAEILVGTTVNTTSTENLVVAPTEYAFGGSSVTLYGTGVFDAATTTNAVTNEYAYNAYGNGVGSVDSTGFTAGPGNTTGTNPSLSDPVKPGTPSCSSYSTTAACMATVIADYASTGGGGSSYGYQAPTTTAVYDPLYPQWLCTVTLPSGLVTPGCGAAPPTLIELLGVSVAGAQVN